MAILRNKVIVRHWKDQVLVLGIKRQEGNAFPFRVKQVLVIDAAIVQAEAGKLGVVIKVQERAVFCSVDARNESAWGGRGGDSEEVLRKDVGGRGKIEDIDLSVLWLSGAVVEVSAVFRGTDKLTPQGGGIIQ